MASITVRLAEMRQRHYLECQELLGLTGHDYGGRNLAMESERELADCYNYMMELARSMATLMLTRQVEAFAENAQYLGDNWMDFLKEAGMDKIEGVYKGGSC